jgi:hypothetical protein
MTNPLILLIEANQGFYKEKRHIKKPNRIGQTLVKGHYLIQEGSNRKLYGYSWEKVGPGQCSCGLLSPDLPSTAARKRWHDAHKDDVLYGRYEPETK